MQLGFIGLGRMGGNMVKRLLQGGHQIVAYNRSPEPTREVEALGATAAYSLEELVKKLPAPRSVWVMVPSGKATAENISTLANLLSAGDTVIEAKHPYPASIEYMMYGRVFRRIRWLHFRIVCVCIRKVSVKEVAVKGLSRGVSR